MTVLKKILLIVLGLWLSSSLFSKEDETLYVSVASEIREDTKTIDIYVNGTTKIRMEDVPTKGYLEIYSLLGVKIKNVDLRLCEEIGRAHV